MENPKNFRRESKIEDKTGTIRIFGPAFPEEITSFGIDETLNSFRQPKDQKNALIEIASLEEGQVFVAYLDGKIVGYVTFHPPEEFERWGQTDIDCILELGAIEVSSSLRGAGVAGALMEISFRGGAMEDYIVIATEYYWHWDLEGMGIPMWEYRQILESIMTSVGMEPKETNDPEICSHPVNVLMVRIGNNVSEEEKEVFEELCQKEEEGSDLFID